jgi:hypothetical protein
MGNLTIGKNQTLLCEFSPSSLLLHLFLAQAVIVGGDIGFKRSPALFQALFLK